MSSGAGGKPSGVAAGMDASEELFPDVIAGLKRLYKEKIRPLESLYKFEDFYSPLLRDSDFEAKPMVLLLGQYSVGKTTFIRYILERDFPGQRIGPEPTTDRFVAVMHGEQDMVIPGNALAIQEDKPFRALNKFGTAFLSKFEAAVCDAPILEHCTFVDTPGVLSGEKQRIGRAYNMVEVCDWFAERCDLILLLFDAHKLDISDEFKRVIETLKGHDDKIRVVLNKADRVSTQQLMRVYGALMWSLGKVVNAPEVVRVYIGSFWDGECQNPDSAALFEAEQEDLLRDLRLLPRNNAVRKVNELVKRARLAKVHAYIIAHLKKEMPSMFYKDSKKKELLESLPDVFHKVMLQHRLPLGDFPDIRKFKTLAVNHDFSKFPKLNQILIDSMDAVLSSDIPQLMQRIAPPSHSAAELNPFAEPEPTDWASVEACREEYDMQFTGAGPVDGKVSGAACKPVLMESGLGTEVLRKIWNLADIDKDGKLDVDEFALAMHLIKITQESEKSLFSRLPSTLYPPGKRIHQGS